MGSIPPEGCAKLRLDSKLSLIEHQTELIGGDTLQLEFTESFPNVDAGKLFQVISVGNCKD